MSIPRPVPDGQDRRKITSRKVDDPDRDPHGADSLASWTRRYLDLAVRGVRSDEVTGKIARHLDRFTAWLTDGLGHDRISAVTPREVAAWRAHRAAHATTGRGGTTTAMAPATVNNHLAHLSALFSWITVHAPAGLLRHGDPTKKVAPLRLPAPQARALSGAQVRTVKNVLDRSAGLHQLGGAPPPRRARPGGAPACPAAARPGPRAPDPGHRAAPRRGHRPGPGPARASHPRRAPPGKEGQAERRPREGPDQPHGLPRPRRPPPHR